MSDNWMKAIHWLCTENPLLGHQVPIEMIASDRGCEQLEKFVQESLEASSPPPAPSSESVQLKAHIDPVTGEPLFTPSSESSRIAATRIPEGFEVCTWEEAMGDGDSRPGRVQKLGHVEDNEYASFYPQFHSENTVAWLRPRTPVTPGAIDAEKLSMALVDSGWVRATAGEDYPYPYSGFVQAVRRALAALNIATKEG